MASRSLLAVAQAHAYKTAMEGFDLGERWLLRTAAPLIRYAVFGSKQHKAYRYVVPEDFSPDVLSAVQVDGTTNFAVALAKVCFVRWMELRSQEYCPLDNYKKNEPLKGVDMKLLIQALAEVVGAQAGLVGWQHADVAALSWYAKLRAGV